MRTLGKPQDSSDSEGVLIIDERIGKENYDYNKPGPSKRSDTRNERKRKSLSDEKVISKNKCYNSKP